MGIYEYRSIGGGVIRDIGTVVDGKCQWYDKEYDSNVTVMLSGVQEQDPESIKITDGKYATCQSSIQATRYYVEDTIVKTGEYEFNFSGYSGGKYQKNISYSVRDSGILAKGIHELTLNYNETVSYANFSGGTRDTVTSVDTSSFVGNSKIAEQKKVVVFEGSGTIGIQAGARYYTLIVN